MEGKRERGGERRKVSAIGGTAAAAERGERIGAWAGDRDGCEKERERGEGGRGW